MKRPVKAEERALWNAAMRGVRKLVADGNAAPPPPAPLETPIVKAQSQPPTVAIRQTSFMAPLSLDTDTERRLETGTARIDVRLDLHGMTERDAHKAVLDMIEESVRRGHRILLVVTGKGRLGNGMLKRNLPLWLEAPALRPFVAGVRTAATRDGGEGAVYVILRRKIHSRYKRCLD